MPADWFYDVRWEEKPRTEDRSVRAVLPEKADDSEPELTATPDRAGARPYHPSAAGRWLVFSDTGGLAQQVAQQLEQDGGECILVQAGDRFDASNPRRPIINVDKPEDYRYLFKDGTLWRGVLHAWTLDAVFDEANALPDLEQAEHLGCGSALFLVQALAEMGSSQPPKLWLLTRGAQTAWPQARLNSIAQAPVWGLGRTLALEHPELWGGLIDVAVDGDPQVLAGRIALEMCFPDREDQIALSGNLRLVPRLYVNSTALTHADGHQAGRFLPYHRRHGRTRSAHRRVACQEWCSTPDSVWPEGAAGTQHLGEIELHRTDLTNRWLRSRNWKNREPRFTLRKLMLPTAGKWKRCLSACAVHPHPWAGSSMLPPILSSAPYER